MPTLARQLLNGTMIPQGIPNVRGGSSSSGRHSNEDEEDSEWFQTVPGGAPGISYLVHSARFIDDPYTEGETDLTLRIRKATIGTTFTYTITSSGGGTPVTVSAEVTDENFDIIGINISGLTIGTLTLSYKEDSVERSTDTALLLPPFDILTTDDGLTPLLADDEVTQLLADAA